MYLRMITIALAMLLTTLPAYAGTKVSIRITGGWPPAQTAEAEAKTRDVARMLATDSRLARCRLSVVVQAGVVHLSGKVFTLEQRAMAAELASRVAGVHTVRNDVVAVESLLTAPDQAHQVVEHT